DQGLERPAHGAGHCQGQDVARADEAAVAMGAGPAKLALVEDRHRPARPRPVIGASRAADAAARDHCRTHVQPIPLRNGSSASNNKVDSAMTYADPRIRGTTLPSTTRTVPSNTLPTILSCRQTSPCLIL